ncbi:MAG: hypothetical protein QOJ63_548 [Solirubrobacteraceae bacterium]|nr:hypothetical protein [Solirubrobacteraceae bacterium]
MSSTLCDLLSQAPAAHRRSVAATLGLSEHVADELAAALLDAERLGAICEALQPAARAAAAHIVVGGGEIAVARYGRKVDPGPARELERHGIAYLFEDTWRGVYHVPGDLRRPLAAALAARHAAAVGNRGAKRWLGAPRQHLHDAATISAFCARTPIRVKADGQVYSRMWPKLVAALAPQELDLDDGHERVGSALDLLRDGGFLRLSVDDRPGVEARRELVRAGDLAGWLARDDGELDPRLPDHPLLAATVALTDALAGRDVLLTGFGAALRGLLTEAGVHIPAGWTTSALVEGGLGTRWRMGALQLGVGSGGKLVAARIAPVEAPAADGLPAICQSNFEVIALRPPTPGERLVLELCCEAVPGQAHVRKLTRASARCGERAGLAGGVLAALAGLCREALPQNVARTVEGWVRDVRAPLRLRSAIMVDAGDVDSAERLLAGPLAGLVVDRLGETMLAVPASRLRQVEQALAAAGEELEAGLDRVSGRWLETPSRSHDALAAWSSRDDEDRDPAGRLTSTLRAEKAQPASNAASRVRANPAQSLASDPIVAVLAALERGGDVFMVYAGARGISERVITPLEIDDARVRAYCHLRGDERSFWLSSIHAATEVG